MATVTRSLLLALAAAACGDVQNFGGDVPPLATLTVHVTGDLESVRSADTAGDPELRVAIVWGAQWLSEPTCTTAPTTVEEGQFLLAGCRHPLFFTPERVGESIAIAPNVPLEFPLQNLPGGDVMIGSLSARIAYASLVVFDDRNGDGLLALRKTQRPPYGDSFGPPEDEVDSEQPLDDIIYGSSFAAMTEPDTRLAFREGAYNAVSAFYPRSGCGEPPPRFGVLRAGGFSVVEAYNASQESRLPAQDPATCAEGMPADMPIEIPLRPPTEVREAVCAQRSSSGSISYHQPPDGPIDFTDRSYLCRAIPNTDPPVTELVVTQRTSDPCRGLTHYVLRGCDDEERVDCSVPNWDFTVNRPEWWPCP
jgi:hypothetical protein